MASKILLLCLLQAFVAHASLPLEMFQRRQASPPVACTFIDEALSFCSSVSPGFLDFPPNSQAPCLCYSISGTTTSWEPNVFDGAVVTCANYIKTAEPTDYATFEALEDFCTSVGDVLQATPGHQTTPVQTSPPTTSQTLSKVPTTTTPTATGLNFPPCTTIGSLIESCASATQGFTDLPGQQQASCLCYSGNKLNPNVFDSPMLSCANYLQTADPSDYSSVSVLVGFCTEYAEVTSSQAPTTKAATITTTPNIFVNTPTATANGQVTATKMPGSGSSLQGSMFRNLFSALAAVVLDMLLIF
jgi:hypothetical protein